MSGQDIRNFMNLMESALMEQEITYWDNGQKSAEVWYKNRKRHRLDRPAFQYWHENGQKWDEGWCINGYYHRLDGPAHQVWYENGQKASEQWWISDIKYNSIQDYANALVELGYKTKSQAMFILSKWS